MAISYTNIGTYAKVVPTLLFIDDLPYPKGVLGKVSILGWMTFEVEARIYSLFDFHLTI